VTTKKKADKNEKHLNQNAHQRAMTSPEVQEVLKVLRVRWTKLSRLQRGEKLNVLIGFNCSARGIANELGEPESTIRRYIALANPPEEGSDWIAQMKSTITKRPKKQGTEGDGEEVSPLLSKIRAKKIVVTATLESHPAQDDAHTSTAQHATQITSHLSTAAKEPPVVSGAKSVQENQARDDTPKKSLADAFLSMGRIHPDKLQRLAAISEQIEARPLRSANSMKRQGRPSPLKDRH
jgi:predicted transcriptional regulator